MCVDLYMRYYLRKYKRTVLTPSVGSEEEAGFRWNAVSYRGFTGETVINSLVSYTLRSSVVVKRDKQHPIKSEDNVNGAIVYRCKHQVSFERVSENCSVKPDL